MRRVKIKDVFDLQMGKTPSRNRPEFWNNGDNDWISIRDLGSFDKYVGKTAETISDQGIVESGIKVVPANTLVMSFKLSLGKTAITVKPTYTNEAIMAFIDKGVYPINLDYFYHQFSGRDWTAGTNKAVMGATLNKKSLGETLIVVPDDREQREVAAVLDRVDGNLLLARRRLQHLDDLVKSRFVEMFGDCERSCTVAESGLYISDGNYSSKYPRSDDFVDSGVPFIRANNIADGRIVDSDMRFITSEKHAELKKGHLITGDVLMTTRGNIGQVAVVPPHHNDSNINAQLVLIRPIGKSWNSLFLRTMLQDQEIQREIQSLETGTALKQLPVGRLGQLRILYPPIEQQRKFAAFVAQVDKSKFAVQQSIEQLELLKASLMQEYFG